ncbi:hypothetical protein JCM3774_004508 [Rhodotorula dairenensis]
MLASPLRRCLLTNKVLPSDMMVRFELTRPSGSAIVAEPAATAAAVRRNKVVDRSKQLVLEPSRVLHPRFDPAAAGHTRGKGLWVTCWSDAVQALAKKGSYKRLHPSATMLPPVPVAAQVHSQLARRVVQEIELVAERIKSWPAVASRSGPVTLRADDDGGVPIRRVSKTELLQQQQQPAEGFGIGPDSRILAAIDLSPSEPGASTDEPICTFVSVEGEPAAAAAAGGNLSRSERAAPFFPLYRLSAFFRAVASLPPDTLRSFRPRQPESPSAASSSIPEAMLLAAAREPLEGMFALLARRAERETKRTPGDGGAGSDDEAASPAQGRVRDGDGDIVLLVAPKDPRTPDERQRADVVVPLAVALRRLQLWTGPGWS